MPRKKDKKNKRNSRRTAEESDDGYLTRAGRYIDEHGWGILWEVGKTAVVVGATVAVTKHYS